MNIANDFEACFSETPEDEALVWAFKVHRALLKTRPQPIDPEEAVNDR